MFSIPHPQLSILTFVYNVETSVVFFPLHLAGGSTHWTVYSEPFHGSNKTVTGPAAPSASSEVKPLRAVLTPHDISATIVQKYQTHALPIYFLGTI